MFGVVKKCRDKETGQVFAAKIVRKTPKSKLEVDREIAMMKKLKHETLVQIYESFENDRQMIIVMEFIPGKELFAKVSEDEVFSEKTAVAYLTQLLMGIQHMHKKYIVHLDIKVSRLCMPSANVRACIPACACARTRVCVCGRVLAWTCVCGRACAGVCAGRRGPCALGQID